jgi:beta-glucanase (GH16 family)
VFSDSFSGAAGSHVDSQWTYDTGTQYNGSGCTASWGTGEVESNTNSTANVALDGSGHLNITPVKSGSSWTSGRIETTADNFAAPPGGELEVSASIKQPNPASGLGYWPAFWMLGAGFRASGAGTSGTMTCSNWPSTGEIDVMEDVNALSEHSGTLHCGVDPGGPCNGAAGGVSGLVEVVLDSPSNAPIGSFAVANTGGWSSWRTVPANITRVTGTHTVYLEFSSGASGNPPYVSLHYFNFPVS